MTHSTIDMCSFHKTWQIRYANLHTTVKEQRYCFNDLQSFLGEGRVVEICDGEPWSTKFSLHQLNSLFTVARNAVIMKQGKISGHSII